MMAKHRKRDTEETIPGLTDIANQFPTPKFVFSLTAPMAVTVATTDVKNAWKDDVETLSTLSKGSPGRKKKTKVRIQSLVVKMINRLVREEVIPYEAIFVLCSEKVMYIRMLVASSAIPIIMLRCEHIGVGNMVGLCFVSPLETSLVPPAMGGPMKKLEVQPMRVKSASWSSQASEDDSNFDFATSRSLTQSTASFELDDYEEESVSSAGEPDDESESKSHGSAVKRIPFMSSKKKKQLNDTIWEARKEWLDTASRVRVAQVVEEVSAGAAFTLDYTAFLICAAVIAGVGLASDSSVTVIASMLISPIMGPVMGFTFGTTVRLKSLICKSLRNELVSLLYCIIIGMICGVVATVGDTPERRDWPSEEMITRGDNLSLVASALVALPSGVAVALSTLNKNSSGMVGVAISLSLLPPAVNTGVCLAYELMLLSDKYDRNEGDDTDYVEVGVISFFVVLVNIACIWVAGVATFELKEVAPIKQTNAFWSRDVQAYRRAEDPHIDVNLEVINDGIKATLELQEAAAANGDIHKTPDPQEQFRKSRKRMASRRSAILGGPTKDFQDNLELFETVIGGSVHNFLHPGGQCLHPVVEASSTKDSLLENANKFGGLEEAGEALFDYDLTGDTGEDTMS